MEQREEKHVYRLEGLSCTNCAAQFENNVKRLPGVIDAQVNFGAAKLTVYGRASIAELEEAGAFENIRVRPDRPWYETDRREHHGHEHHHHQAVRWREYAPIVVSAALAVVGFVLAWRTGEGSFGSVAAFAAAIVIGGWKLFVKGLKNLFRFQFDMNVLMTVAVIGAALIGEWGEGAVVVVLFSVSELLEHISMEKARQSIRSLMDLAPKEALIRRDGAELTVGAEDIRVGDILIVKPGQKVAMDGVVVKGMSSVNQAAITGESVPVTKTVGDEVFAGTLNQDGLLEVEVTKRVEDTALAKIIHLVEEAQARRAPSQAFIDRFARYYTPAIMALALAVALVPPLLGGGWSEWIYRALALLVVGCPCALVISTPVAIVTAIGNAARHGVLIKGGIHLEEAGRLAAVAFDKTGTLTQGVPEVTDVLVFRGEEAAALEVAAALERASEHPLAAAVVRYAARRGVDGAADVADFRAVAGRGVEARVGGRLYMLGSPGWISERGVLTDQGPLLERVAALQREGKTVVLLGTEGQVLAAFAVADTIRPSSQAVVDRLHRMGIAKTVMLTGDNRATAESVARQVGVADVRAELLPQDKLAVIQELRERYGKVAMVGDGVNDAPALAAATVGIAMGGAGTDTALETADIALMADDLRKLPYTIRLSRKTLAVIKQNVAFALGLKLLAVLLIVPGWLTLWMAVFADIGATLLVTLNSMRLLRVKE